MLILLASLCAATPGIKRFEKVHSGHTIMTTDINEVKGAYSSFKNHTNEKATQETE